MKSSSRVVLLIFTFVLLFLPVISAYSVNTFNNSEPIEYLDVLTTQNVTRYLEINENELITTGYFTVAGFNYSTTDTSSLDPYTVAEYKLDELSGDVVDSSGNGRNGQANNGVLRGESGVLNRAFYFDGSDDFVNTSNVTYFPNLSFSLWFKDGFVVSNENTPTTSNRINYYGFNDSGNLTIWSRNRGSNAGVGCNYYYQSISTNIPISQWNNIVINTNTFLGTEEVFINNVNYSSSWVLNTACGAIGNWGGSLTLGRYDVNGAITYVAGTVDQFVVYNKSLNSTEVNDVYSVTHSQLDNPRIFLNDTLIWDYTGEFNDSVPEENTTDLSNTINTYLDSCVFAGGVCAIPFLFTSESNGILRYSNLTFQSGGFIENSVTYNQNTISGANEDYKINLTFDSSQYTINVKLNFNGTNYSATTSDTGNVRVYSKSLTLPTISTPENVSLIWYVDITNGTTNTYNSNTYYQTISTFAIDNCSVYTFPLMNFTLYDEDDQSLLNGVNDSTSIKIDFTFYSIEDNIVVLNYSDIVSSVNPAQLCLLNDLNQTSYKLEGVVQYSSLDRFSEFYHFENYTLSNSTADINFKLYDLSNSTGQEFKITYKDANFVPVDNVILDIQRKYTGTGQFLTVERPKTGGEGYTTAHLVPADAIYNIYVLQKGTVVATFENIIASCQNPLITDCEINLNSYGSGGLASDFTNANDITFTSINYDTDTRVVSTTFIIPSGVSADVNLEVTLYDRLGTTAVCNDTVSSVSGSLSCTVPASFGNTTVIAKLYKDGVQVSQAIILARETPQTLYGDILILASVVMFLFFIGFGASSDNPMVMGFALIFGTITMVALNIFYSPSFFGAGASILWFVVAVILLAIKGASRQ